MRRQVLTLDGSIDWGLTDPDMLLLSMTDRDRRSGPIELDCLAPGENAGMIPTHLLPVSESAT